MNYLAQIIALLPKGKMWEIKDGSNLHKLLCVVADAFSKVHKFYDSILTQSDVSSATEQSLDEWERDYGLPDVCSFGVNTLPSERRLAVKSRINMGAGQEIKAYEQILTDLGYTGTVQAFTPFICGKSRLGKDVLNNEARCRYCLLVTFYPRTMTFVNDDGETEQKTVYGDDLMCTLDRMKQSHTRILYKILEA